MAEELKETNSEMLQLLESRLKDISVSFVPHEALKKMSEESVAIIRTGEIKSYCNIVLRAGVNF